MAAEERAATVRLELQRVSLDDVDWAELDAYDDRIVFQTREWLELVASTQHAEPVVAELRDGERVVGHFTGLTIRRFGIPILGSPFPGWGSGSMGFNLREGVSRRAAVEALLRYAFGPLGCLHVELKDRLLGEEDVAGLGLRSSPKVTFELDLEADEDEIFGRMASACRRAIRKGVKEGVTIEEASGVQFADEYYAQLVEVFARQSLRPTYGVELVQALIRLLEPTGHLLLLRARAPDGTPIATSITLGLNDLAYFWGGASWRAHQIHRPNEALFWHAIRHWKARGATILDMGGGGDYKRKYGPRERQVPFFRKSRYRALMHLRDGAEQVARLRQRRVRAATPGPTD